MPMLFDANFTIIQDDLSAYLDTRNKDLLKESMLQLEHGCLLIEVGFRDSKFILHTIELPHGEAPLAKVECPEPLLEEQLSEMCQMVLDYELALQADASFSAYYSEFFRTIRDNRLRLTFVEGASKSAILRRISRDFVEGTPRAFWLSLKQAPMRLGEPTRDPYWRLQTFIPNERVLYFIIDMDNSEYAVYRGSLKDIHTFIGDCECLDEYYLMSLDGNEFWCITDHDELLYVRFRDR